MTAFRAKLAAGLVLGLACGASAYWVRPWFDPSLAVELSPSSIELVREPSEGESVTVSLQLTNRGATEITLQEIRSSCRCTSVVTRGGRSLGAPMPIPPGQSVPWEATIDTSGRYGEQRFRIGFVLQGNGRQFERHALIKMSVRGGWRVAPYELVLADVTPGAPFEAELDLYDGHPDPGLSLKEAISLNSEWIRVRVEPATSRSGPPAYPPPFQKRYKLTVFGEVPPEHGRLFQSAIAVRAENHEIPEFRIPVRGRTRDVDYRLYPPALEIDALRAGAAYRRIVDCEVRSEEVPLPNAVISKPDFLDVRISWETQTLARIEVACGDLSAAASDASAPREIVLGSDGKPLVVIPVRLFR
jgi:hypothetical protein